MFDIQGYSYSIEDLVKVNKGLPLDLEVLDYQPLSLRQYVLMRKSLALYARYLEKAMPAGITPGAQKKAAAKLPAGQRWITVHPNGSNDKGVPVLIQEDGGGTAHVIGGAGGRINMLKLNNVKSKEEYADLARERRQREADQRAQERKQKEIAEAGLSREEKAKLKEMDENKRELESKQELERQEKIKEAKHGFLKTVADMLGWEDKTEEIKTKYMEARKAATEGLKTALESEDKEQIKKAKKDVRIIDKGYDQAIKSYEGNMMAAAKNAVSEIRKEAIADEQVRTALEERIGGKTGAEEEIRTESESTSKGFLAEYGSSAEKKGLTSEQISVEKEELFQANLERIAQEIDPRLAVMIEKGVQTKRLIGEVKRDLYEREKLVERVMELDKKAEVIKKYIEMNKIIQKEEEPADVEDLQKTLDDETKKESDRDLNYGDGLALDSTVTVADFVKELEKEASRMESERQAELNSSLLDKIKDNPNGSEKWIANGHFQGFNRLSLSVLKDEGISRDVSDILGLRASAQLLARVMRDSLSDEDYADAAEAVQRFHADMGETMVKKAVDTAEELFKKVEGIDKSLADLKATNPDDLAMLKELNETRIKYLDEANRALGQTLGDLEAEAAMGSLMKGGGRVKTIDTNLGDLSSEAAIVRMRALGLSKEDYHIETINGDRIATINESGVDKLTKAMDPEEVAIERDIEDIKRGVYDEKDWLPAGLVARPIESYQDPGIDPEVPEGGIDNQSLADDAEGMKATQEAAHRALGEMPEGRFAFSSVDDLDPKDQTDLRRYWENNLHKGSMAERLSTRGYQGEKSAYSNKSGSWQTFLAEKGGSDASAYEAIKADIIDRAPEDAFFGGKILPPIVNVQSDDISTYRDDRGNERVEGANSRFERIDDFAASLEAKRDELTAMRGKGDKIPKEKIEKAEKAIEQIEMEMANAKASLSEDLKGLYNKQLRGHFYTWMSGLSETELEADTGRFENSPWAEYVRMHGDVGRAQSAVLEIIKGRFVDKFSKQYGRVTKKPLATQKSKISEYRGHLLGMLGKEDRDSVINKVQAELASAGATVANRSGGKFATGSWREKAIDLIEQRRKDEASQSQMFGESELKQDDGTERTSIGKRAEEQLASILPGLGQNQLRGQKYAVNSMQTDGVRQRAIKMFQRTKRMNLSFGTGKGKTIISIGAFTELHSKGMAKRAIFAVPSVVQSQFGNEVNVFCEPGKYKVASDPSLDREGRIAALKDPKNHMVVLTHQSLRDDLIYLMAGKMGKTEEEAKDAFNAMSEPERAKYLGETVKENGIDFDMLTVDEAHYTSNRKGKEDSTLSNVMDALNKNTEYFMAQTATPVKNDISEAFDMLHKVAPGRFNDRNEFIKKYGVDSDFSREALQRVISRYNYASPSVTGVKSNRTKEAIQLTPEQQHAYDEVESAFRRASRAQKSGTVDIEAMKILSPNSFKAHPEGEHEELAKRLQSAIGTIKEEALNRVVNTFDPKNNGKINRLMELVESKKYIADNAKTAAKKGDRAPGVVFAHNLASVEALRSAFADKGLRVGVIQGTMSGAEKEKVKQGFNPPVPSEREYDMLVLSDAGATGLNLQNAKFLINYDLPHTAWVKTQREGRIDRMGQAHGEIDYHDLVSDTAHESKKWDRIQRKERLGAIFQDDPGATDDTGLSSYLAAVKQERYNNGMEEAA